MPLKSFLPEKGSLEAEQFLEAYRKSDRKQRIEWAKEYGYKTFQTLQCAVRDRLEENVPLRKPAIDLLAGGVNNLELQVLRLVQSGAVSVGEISRSVNPPYGVSAETVIKTIDTLREKSYEITLDEISRQVFIPQEPSKEFKPTEFKYYKKQYQFGLVSDTQMGSLYHQVTLLHDAYADFNKRQVDFVLHAGDLVEGRNLYRGQDMEVFLRGADEQKDYVIKNYPVLERGRKTYIVGGQHDRSFFRDSGYNIIRAICKERKDLVDRGFYKAEFIIKGLKIGLQHPSGGVAYARSYRMQKIIENMIGFIATIPVASAPIIQAFGHWHIPCHLPCVDAETECLTEDGWKSYQDLRLGEKIMAYDIIGDCVEYQPIEGIFTSPYQGEMVSIQNKPLDILMTPNHRCVVVKNGHISLLEVKELKSRHAILLTAPFNNNYKKRYSDAFIELLGWIMAEGQIRDGKGKGRIDTRIVQSLRNYRYVYEIADCLNRTKLKYHIHFSKDGVAFFSLGARETRRIVKVLKANKPFSHNILRLPHSQLEILFNTLMKGDGSNRGDSFSQESNASRDVFQHLCVLLGKRVSKRSDKKGMELSLRSPRYAGIRRNDKGINKSIVVYNGVVWCPQVKAGAFVARRNGRTFITGNSYMGVDAISLPCFQSQTPYLEGKGLMPTVGYAVAQIYLDKDNNLTSTKIEFIVLNAKIIARDY